MAGDTIYLQDVLRQMRTLDGDGRAVPFDIKVRTFQKYSGKGGKLNHYPKAKMVMKEENPNADSVRSLRTAPRKKAEFKKPPDHFENKTRNIKVIPGGDIVKIKIRFIIEFNGKKVIY
ncbi:MAG: hypothetical protein WBG90_18420 [Saonia sp.]